MKKLHQMLPRHAPSDPVAYKGGKAITSRQLHADAHALAKQLPAHGQMLNTCTDRYWFVVGMAAAMLRGHLSVLPHSHLTDAIVALKQAYPNLYSIAGPAITIEGLPQVTISERHARCPEQDYPPLAFPADQNCACLFTSGSTGQPVAYDRAWGMVIDSAVSAARQLGTADQEPAAILATVPAQHSYGFESSIFLALITGGAICAEQPFYPADIAQKLQHLPRPRVLVTTPVHLRALLGARLSLPPVDMLLSATALLPRELAIQAEEQFGAPLQEIYGATETGQTASRRPVRESRWTPLPGVNFTNKQGAAWASGAHVGGAVKLSDLLEIGQDGRFRLVGRAADMVNVAGKRSSIAHLNGKLNSIAGVTDGVFLLTDSKDDLMRLTAFFVSDTLSRAQVLEQLKQHVEPAFMPRPLIQLAAVPRNSTGKATRQRLLDLLAAHGGAHRSEQP